MNINFLQIYKNHKKKIISTGVIVCVLITHPLYTFTTKAGFIQHSQNTLLRSVDIYANQGLKLKMPFFTTVTTYNKAATVAFTGEPIDSNNPITRIEPMINIWFADTYTSKIPVSVRFRLLNGNKDKFKETHDEFRSYNNVVMSLLVKTTKDVVINTATQYSGEEFFQGGLNQFKYALNDQLRNGVYKTERKRVEVEEMGLAAVGLDQEDSNALVTNKTMVWKTIPVLDKEGNIERISNPLSKYGIKAVQVNIGNPIPEQQLATLLSDKKKLVADRIKTIQEQETAREQAKTAQMLGEIDRTKAKQLALKTKDLAIIAKQQEVESEQKQAEKEVVTANKVKELAVIDKARELEIAEANVQIQKANFAAAQFEAKAIEEKGIAQANVLNAKYKARDSEIYMAELQRDIANIMYQNLANFNVTMPQNMVTIGNDSNQQPLQSNLDVLSSFASIGVMNQLSESITSTK